MSEIRHKLCRFLPTFRSIGIVLIAIAGLVSGCASSRIAIEVPAVSVDGDRIGVQDSCHDDPQLEVTETDASIEFEFSVAAEDSGDCSSCTIATLESAVAERPLIDATTGEEASPTGDCFS